MASRAHGYGTVVMGGKEFQALLNEETERAQEYMQLAYDLTMEMMSTPVPTSELDPMTAQITDEGLSGLMSQRPDAAIDVMRRVEQAVKNA